MRPRFTLASRILALQLGIIIVVVAAGAVASMSLAREQLDRSYAERALAVADSVAALPEVRDAVLADDRDQTLQPLAERIRLATGATFIVITDDQGIRFSHPNPERIGERVSTDPDPALRGERWSGTQEGTLGVSVRGKVPIRDTGGTVIGMVSVGFLQEQVSSELIAQLLTLGAYLAAALVLGTIASLLLARHLRRQTFGLEPSEIASLLEQREAVLHGIREGIVAVDLDGRLTLVNDEARRLLALEPEAIGRPVEEVIPAGRIRDVLLGELERPDLLVVTEGRVLVANRMPVYVRGKVTGSVVSFRDRTELAEVTRELDGIRAVTDALRAQAHEFSNRLHTIVGLVELGRHGEAISLSTADGTTHQELVEMLLGRIGNPTLGALLLAKAVVASERGISLRISDDTLVATELPNVRDLVTIVGNLVDNAFDAVAADAAPGDRWVEVGVRADADTVVLRIADSGPGIDATAGDRIFEEGFTTKEPGAHPMRGLGLALVAQVVRRLGGEIAVSNEPGAVFTVRLPQATSPGKAAPAAEAAAPGQPLAGSSVR
ncbi:MAG: sensor histidine kinase [Chloroflexota bacterium]